MKNVGKTFFAMIIAGTMAFGTAAAMTFSQGTSIVSGVPGVSSGSVSVTIRGDVATLTGNTESGWEATTIQRYVANHDGVEQVINLISYN